jgi:hypothetical protein
MKTVLLRYDASGTLVFEVDIKKLAYLTVIITAECGLLRIRTSYGWITGLILLDIEPFDDPDKIVALVVIRSILPFGLPVKKA